MKFLSFSVPFFLIIVLAFSCKDESMPESISLLKKKIKYTSIAAINPVATYEYKYDHDRQLETITEGNWYLEHYSYITAKALVSIEKYHDGIIHDSTIFSYSNGLPESEMTIFFPHKTSTVFTKFTYNDSKQLVKKICYIDHEFSTLTTFKYENGQCVKETICSDSIGESPMENTYHYYNRNKRSSTKRYSVTNIGYERLQQQINYFYDEKEKLITEESIQMDYETPIDLNYVYRYEYY